jgi:uracil-DNA glycosylase
MILSEIYQKVNKCEKCKLCKNRIADYNFRGKATANVVLVGEAPGKNEQEMGFPFIGRSGQLLDSLLQEASIDPKNDIYITNLVKDRPIDSVTGKDRKPFYDEIVTCAPYLMEELEILKPALVVTLGKTSGDWFSNYGTYEVNKYYPDRKWLPLYHPSYLLQYGRNEIPKFREALKKVKEFI